MLVYLIVLVLSHLALRQTRICPDAARSGRHLTGVQAAACQAVEVQVRAWFSGLLLPSDRGKCKMEALLGFIGEVQAARPGVKAVPPAALAVREFKCDRAQYMRQPLNFDCTPHLAVFEAAAFI